MSVANFDDLSNFSYSSVLTAPSPATSGTSLVVQSGNGGLFPTPPFNAVVWPAGSSPISTNAEIVRVTAVVSDTFTIVRTQESTSARSIVVGDQIMAAMTRLTLQAMQRGVLPTSTIAASTYTLTTNDNNINANAASNAITLTLPAASAVTGKTFTIKKIDSSANQVTIQAAGSDLIDGFSPLYLVRPNDAFSYVSDGTSWRIANSNYRAKRPAGLIITGHSYWGWLSPSMGSITTSGGTSSYARGPGGMLAQSLGFTDYLPVKLATIPAVAANANYTAFVGGNMSDAWGVVVGQYVPLTNITGANSNYRTWSLSYNQFLVNNVLGSYSATLGNNPIGYLGFAMPQVNGVLSTMSYGGWYNFNSTAVGSGIADPGGVAMVYTLRAVANLAVWASNAVDGTQLGGGWSTTDVYYDKTTLGNNITGAGIGALDTNNAQSSSITGGVHVIGWGINDVGNYGVGTNTVTGQPGETVAYKEALRHSIVHARMSGTLNDDDIGTPGARTASLTYKCTAGSGVWQGDYNYTRSVSDAVFNSTTTVTSATAAFTAADKGRAVTGTNVQGGTVINTVVSATQVTLSLATTATGSGKTISIGTQISYTTGDGVISTDNKSYVCKLGYNSTSTLPQSNSTNWAVVWDLVTTTASTSDWTQKGTYRKCTNITVPSAVTAWVEIAVPSTFRANAEVGICSLGLTGTNKGASYSVVVDGATPSGGGYKINNSTTNTFSTNNLTNTGLNGAPQCLRITGLAAGAHTIKITPTTLNQEYDFNWWGYGSATQPTPCVLVNIPPCTTYAGYANTVTGTTGNTNVNTYNALYTSLVSEFPDGSVQIADLYTAFGGSSPDQKFFYSDGLHPSNRGAAVMAKTVYDAVQQFPEDWMIYR